MRSIRQAGHRFSKRTLVIGAAAMIAVPLAAAADAATPDSAIINGCYLKATGSLRVIDPSAGGWRGQCLAAETPISWNQVGPQGPQGEQGVPGPQGEQGIQGVPGPAGVSGYVRVQQAATVAPQQVAILDVPCPAGKMVVGGGFYSITSSLPVQASFPVDDQTWRVVADNGGSSSAHSLFVFALCANAS